MRDEMDARMWVAHHEDFADGVDRALARLKSVATRFASWDGSSYQLVALVLSFAITTLTFHTTA